MNRLKPLFTILFSILSFNAQAAVQLDELEAPVKVVRDTNGIPHIYASNEHDLFFMQGRIHAEDRLFQMDVSRRSAAGTLAELFGPTVLETDVETRTIGLSRAAERSLAAHPPEMLAVLQAYADGVNSYLDEIEPAGLPLEYASLGLTSVERWKPLDSVLVGKALAAITSLIVTDDIDLTVALKTYEGIGAATGGAINGTALFFDDLFRSAPFDTAVTVADSQTPSLAGHGIATTKASSRALEMAQRYARKIRKLPRIPGAIKLDGDDMGGSNTWVVSGKHTRSRRPLLANDLHLSLQNPAIFHEIELAAPTINVSGHSLAGAPCVVRGHNRTIAWGVTNARLDITDIYAEIVQADDASDSGWSILHNGVAEPIELEIESFSANIGGSVVPYTQAPVLIVPRRNNGPLITEPDALPGPFPGTFTAFSVQSVGFGPTRDPEGLCAVNRARNLDEFKRALTLVDFASQNFTYADKHGNIAYFTSGELPLREDLQNPSEEITPPFMIRNGYTGNEWQPLEGELPENQATPFEILPFEEMPQVVNPPGGFIVNANNDPLGNTLDNNPLNDLRTSGHGLRYLNWGGRNFSIRAGRVTEMLQMQVAGGAKLNLRRMKAMQADTVLNDAKALMPFILDAYDNATGSTANPALADLASDPRVAEAIARFRHWDYTTPTGLAEGYDANPDASDSASVAASIYAVWRGRMVANSIDATLDGLPVPNVPRPARREEVVTALKHLLERDGEGVSGLNFFNVPFITDAAIRRDFIVLYSLADALDLMASPAFEPAFELSTSQDDYRWGKLHRVTFAHPLGTVEDSLNVPPALGFFPPPLAPLAGIPIDGGFETVDEAPPLSANNVRVSDSDSMMVEFGPSGRFVAAALPTGVTAQTSLPGGNSAVPGNPFFLNLLEPYLNNKTFRMLTRPIAVLRNAHSIDTFVPKH